MRMRLEERCSRVVSLLRKAHPAAACSLRFSSKLQLLIATMLSAQCTDTRVNLVTRSLFRRYRTARNFATAPIRELEAAVRSTGFYRNKAKNIQKACQAIVERFGGRVPETMDDLTSLPGVGRKTANVVLGVGFGKAEGVVVDTHVTRIANRLGLTTHTDPRKIEQDLMRIIPKKDWIDLAHLMIAHGRAICQARKPKCPACPVRGLCPSTRRFFPGIAAGKRI